jgi:hypothetical protein
MRISDKDVKKVLENVYNEDEQALAEALVAILKLQFNNRQFLRKIWSKLLDMNKCDCVSNLKTDPLDLNDNDILIGGVE